MTYLRDNRSIYAQAAKTNELYDRFKKRAAEHFVSVKVALREAMLLWIKHEMGDTEFARYTELNQSYKDMRDDVRGILESQDVDEVEKRINIILEKY